VLIAMGDQGKPFLKDTALDLRFNLSHVDDLLILAVTAGVEVGVDCEKIESGKPVHTMARLAFSRREQEELFAMPVSLQIEAFYHCWVRKEACMKACGRGFSVPGNSFDTPVCLEKLPIQTLISCNQSFWHVQDLDAPENYCAAVAVAANGASPSPPAIVRVVPIT
jgi:4'-phosphopantetheinyl transferase